MLEIEACGFIFTEDEIREGLNALKILANKASSFGNGISFLDYMTHPLTKNIEREMALYYVSFIYGHKWSYSPSKKKVEQLGRPGF